MRFRKYLLVSLLSFVLTAADSSASDKDLQDALLSLNQVGNVGLGHAEAMRAWQVVAATSAMEMPTLLAAIDDAKPLGANWIRAAVDQIAERALKSGKQIPADRLETLILQDAFSPRARRLAFEWLVRVDDTARDRIIPQELNDSSVEMRRDAVQQLMDEAEAASSQEESRHKYRRALTAARDTDQIEQAFEKLSALGESVDLARHYGFITKWKLIGPFDNTNKGGFAVEYPPEKELEWTASYPGKHDDVKWGDYATTDKFGMVDLNQGIGKHMGAAGYAATTFHSATDQEVDLRLGCICASQVWLNGELLMSNEVYHSGTKIDQYVTRARLKQGPNTILVKVCQNEQTDAWAQDWQFQFRVCDQVGSAILSTDR